jgi:hypothetical protein
VGKEVGALPVLLLGEQGAIAGEPSYDFFRDGLHVVLTVKYFTMLWFVTNAMKKV